MKKINILVIFAIAASLVLSGCSGAGKTDPEDPDPKPSAKSDECTLKTFDVKKMLNTTMTSDAKGVLVNATCAALKNYWYISVTEGADLSKVVPSFTASDKSKIIVNGKEFSVGQQLDFTNIVDLTVVSESEKYSTNYKIVMQHGNPAVDVKVYEFMKIYGLPGISISVMQDENTIYSKGYGAASYLGNKYVRMTPDHLLRLASVSKTFCAVALMVLYERGKLTIDDKVFGENGILNDEYPLPAGADERIKNITIRNFMQHNSGWSYSDCGGYDYAFDIAKTTSIPDRINKLLKVKLGYDVGSHYSYFNMGYMILGEVVKKISGKDYEQFLKEDVLAPMGITNIHIGGGTLAERRPDECVYYGQSSHNPYNGNNFQTIASLGGVIASTNQLMRYLASIDGRSGVPDILKKSTLDLMYKTTSAAKSTRALCWMVNHSYWPGAHFHTGDLNGTASILVGDNKNGRSGAVVCNSRSYLSGQTYIYGKGSFDDNLYGLMKYVLDYSY